MQTEKRNMIPFLIVIYPMVYCFLSIVVSTLLKKSICIWFETVLYMDEEEEERSRNGRVNMTENGEDPPDNMLEHTINSDGDEDGNESGENRR